MSLPYRLQGAVTAWLAAHQGSRRQGSAALSATYRAGGTSTGIDLGSYLVARLPATYAAVDRVMCELARLSPDFSPKSLLDAGSGPGTASWAAVERWPCLETVTFLDADRDFLALAADLAQQGPPQLAHALARHGRLDALADALAADMVIAAYALAELPLAQVVAAAEGLWQASRQALVLVEPGTPQGFARLRMVRDKLVGTGAVPLAPCTHGLACPMAGNDWCHFSVRLPRSRAHMHAKGAHVPFEDERFSYLVLARQGTPPAGCDRVIAPPQHAKPGVTLRLCTGQGEVAERFVARRAAAAYKKSKKLEWGDLFTPLPEEESP